MYNIFLTFPSKFFEQNSSNIHLAANKNIYLKCFLFTSPYFSKTKDTKNMSDKNFKKAKKAYMKMSAQIFANSILKYIF